MAVIGLTGCTTQANQPTGAQTITTVTASGPSEDALRASATALNEALDSQDAKTAWNYYSQRCKNFVGDVESYEQIMKAYYQDRDPKSAVAKVTVNGASGQVVTIDSDPAAPASSSEAKTWTFIENRWQFDSC